MSGVIAALLTVSAAQPFAKPASAAEAGRPGWALEHFGADVTILRMRGSETRAPRGTEVLLSCEGRDRRFRLVLPAEGAWRLGDARIGSMLIRPPGGPSSRQAPIATPYALAGDRVVVVSEDGPNASGDAVLPIARMLSGQPGSLDILIHPGPPPVILNRLLAVHLPLSFGPGDAAAFRDFVEVCGRDGG